MKWIKNLFKKTKLIPLTKEEKAAMAQRASNRFLEGYKLDRSMQPNDNDRSLPPEKRTYCKGCEILSKGKKTEKEKRELQKRIDELELELQSWKDGIL